MNNADLQNEFKTGDRIRVIRPEITCGEYVLGSIGTLHERDGKNGWFIDFDHNPMCNKCYHVYTDEFILIEDKSIDSAEGKL